MVGAESILIKRPNFSWRQQSVGMKALFLFTLLALGVAAPCFLIVSYIETVAVGQPSVANSVFRHPHLVKGVIRFLTDQQDSIYSIVQPIWFPAWIVLVVLGGTYSLLVRRQSEKIERKKMDQILGGGQ
jgi:hypothetical protein